jgi:hypothetical protein
MKQELSARHEYPACKAALKISEGCARSRAEKLQAKAVSALLLQPMLHVRRSIVCMQHGRSPTPDAGPDLATEHAPGQQVDSGCFLSPSTIRSWVQEAV